VTLPFTNSEVFIEKMTSYIAVKAVLGLVAMWNEDDSFMVRISSLCNKPAASYLIKGLVHPKMKILSSFTHPQVVQNLYVFLSPAEHKSGYFEQYGPNS